MSILMLVAFSTAGVMILILLVGREKRNWPATAIDVEISARKMNFVRACACCLERSQLHEYAAYSTRVTGIRVVRYDTRYWQFPYCVRCLNHVSAWESRYALFRLWKYLNILAAAVWFFQDTGSTSAWLLFIIGNPALLVSASLYAVAKHNEALQICSEGCVHAGAAVRYFGWRGSTHSFRILRDDYALAFMRRNENKLINVPGWLWERLSNFRENF